jgi:hypothetical protein
MSTPITERPWQRADALILAALLALTAAWTAVKLHWAWTPMEDASMLLRYAQNLATGHGIRWSLNQAPVDGATDFLYMALTAALSRLLHIGVIPASRCLNIAAQLGSVALIYTGARSLGGTRWLSTAAALYLIAGPFTGLATACFGAPVFAFFLLSCWSTGLRYALHTSTWKTALSMATLALLAGLTRPEGVLIAALLLVATLYLVRDRNPAPKDFSSRPEAQHTSINFSSRPEAQRSGDAVERPALSATTTLLLAHALIFATLGTAYFAWHWHYFGYPLPNPFYIKGDGHLYFDSVKHAAMNLVTLLLPALPLVPLGWLNASTRRLTNALIFILVAFALMWILLSNQNNHFYRFQYAVVPLVLMTVPALANGARTRFGVSSNPTSSSSVGSPAEAVPAATLVSPQIGYPEAGSPGLQPRVSSGPITRKKVIGALAPIQFAAVLAILAAMLYSTHIFDYYNATELGMKAFALRLQPLASRGYTMAVTEAGALPLYSQWNAIDALGLNDSYIAHHRYLDRDYLDRTHPELILVHIDSNFPGEFDPGGLTHLPSERNVFYNAEFLNYYAASHGYTLAAIWGSDPCNLHLYWLQPNIPDYETVLSDIRDHPYYFLDNGTLAHDFRNEQDTLQACALPTPN